MPGNEQRLTETGEAHEFRLATCSDDTKSDACRCVACRRALKASASVRLGIGPVCRRRVSVAQTAESRQRAIALLDALRAHLDAEDGPTLVLTALADAVALVGGEAA